MQDRNLRCSRRKFLAQAAALTMVGGLSPSAGAKTADSTNTFRARPSKPSKSGRKPIAVISTVYRPLSHAYHIAGRFIQGYARNGAWHVPQHFVSTLYVDQAPDNDLSREVAHDFDIRLGVDEHPQPGSKDGMVIRQQDAYFRHDFPPPRGCQQ